MAICWAHTSFSVIPVDETIPISDTVPKTFVVMTFSLPPLMWGCAGLRSLRCCPWCPARRAPPRGWGGGRPLRTPWLLTAVGTGTGMAPTAVQPLSPLATCRTSLFDSCLPSAPLSIKNEELILIAKSLYKASASEDPMELYRWLLENPINPHSVSAREAVLM